MKDRRGAIFSPCERYRWNLWRYWDDTKPALVFVMLNPSTADAEKNDPTVERCERRARALGYGGVEVANLFAFRSTDPAGLYRLPSDEAIGDNNDAAILGAAKAGRVVAAWGAHGILHGRGQLVAQMLRKAGIGLWVLALTKQGEPRHPLYLPNSAILRPWTDLDARLDGAPIDIEAAS